MDADLGRQQGQGHREACALIRTATFRMHLAPVQFDQASRDGEPQAQTAVLAGSSALRLPECVEDVGKEFRADTDPSITHGKPRLTLVMSEGYRDAAIPGRKLDRIRNQVADDLLQPFGITADEDRRLG